MKTRKQFLGIIVLAIIAIAFAITACPDPEPDPVIVTKTVTVTFPAYTSGQTSISFAPTYTPDGGWGEFSASEITYTVTCTELSKPYDSVSGFNVTIASGSYSGPNTYTFVQTFKMGTKTAETQTIKIDVSPMGTFGVLKNASNVNLDPQAIPPVTLTLSKAK